ncbi:transposase [Streptomyces sp. BBFR102]|uniref:transposase n=1 Tax=Streptomyces sp. BBFR102 TaxID=3448171 RepID=UPI003F531439
MSEEEWRVVRRRMPLPGWLRGRGGNPEGYCHREMSDAVRYFDSEDIKWRAMPSDFPPWGAVYAFARGWQAEELLDVLHDRLREQVRLLEGRDDPEPSAAIVDSRSLRGAATLTGDDMSGFVVLPRRWVVGRALAWLVNCRRLVRDYERTGAAHPTAQHPAGQDASGIG